MLNSSGKPRIRRKNQDFGKTERGFVISDKNDLESICENSGGEHVFFCDTRSKPFTASGVSLIIAHRLIGPGRQL